MERHAVARLIGAPPGYVGYDEGGQLTERVRRRPYSVILLDEIEKAHPDVNNVLLQVFDDGRLTDGKGRVVDFSSTIIIATSNLGASVIMDNLEKSDKERDSEKAMRAKLMDVLKGHFRPEFLNRIDEIIVFHGLSRENIRSIVQIQIDRVKRTAAAQDITLKVQEPVIDHLADVGYRPEFGARELKRQIRQELETHLAKEILGDKLKSGDTVDVSFDKEADKVAFTKVEAPAQSKEKEKKARPAAKKSATKAEGKKESAKSES
jgi:ATP-dependent Clp protease ATP-binding subunit ClpC